MEKSKEKQTSKIPGKTSKKRDAVRPASILSNSSSRSSLKKKENGQTHSRSGSRASFACDGDGTAKNGDSGSDGREEPGLALQGLALQGLALQGGPAPRSACRADSLPGTVARRLSLDAVRRLRPVPSRKPASERPPRDRMSLDFSRISDCGDSEEENSEAGEKNSKKTTKSATNMSRRKRSVDRNDSTDGFLAIASASVPSGHRAFSRRSSLQSFSPRALSFASFENSFQSRNSGTHSVRPQDVQRRSAATARKYSLGSGLSRPSEFAYSSDSPDLTSETSACENSPCKLSPVESASEIAKRDSEASNVAFDIATVSPEPACAGSGYRASWIENDCGCSRDDGNESMDGNVSENTPKKERGEWNSFWHNYNSSLAAFPKKFFYDDCPTPFYAENEQSDDKAFENNKNGRETLAPQPTVNGEAGIPKRERKFIVISKAETKEMIHCAHRLADILTAALERENKVEESEGSRKKEVTSKGIQVELMASSSEYDIEELQNELCKLETRDICEILSVVPEMLEVETKADKRKRELKDITILAGDSKDVLL